VKKRSRIRSRWGGAYSNGRYIATLNGTSQYITHGTVVNAVVGDVYKSSFATSQTGVIRDLLGGIVQFDAANLLQLTNCTAKIDGVTVADGASIAAYLDYKLHEIELTFTGAATIEYIGQSGVGTNFFAGAFLDNYFTPVATGITAHYPVSNGSLTGQGDLVFTNFISATWELFTRDTAGSLWEGVERLADNGFNTACGVNWTCGVDWGIAAGVASVTVAAALGTIYQPNSVTAGQRFRHKYSITTLSGGAFRPYVGGTLGVTSTAVGDYSEVIIAGSVDTAGGVKTGQLGTTGSIDNVCLKRVIEDA
jgi:hypothetical protein